jgi:hypothetical protein
MQNSSTTRQDEKIPLQRWETLGVGILILAIAFQLFTTFNELILPVGSLIWESRTEPAWERTGSISSWAGEERTAFLAFLREQTPPDATLVFFEKNGLYSWWPALQYFLFPRHVQVCVKINDACWQSLPAESSYFVRIEGAPTSDSLPFPMVFMAYQAQQDKGLFAPKSDLPTP